MTLADFRVGLRAHLLASGEIATIVGTRVYPIRMPQGETRASIVYHRISGQGDHHLQGPSGLSRPRIQIDCWSQTADQADALARMVKERIDGFRGEILWGDNSPADAIRVQGVFFESERDDYDDTAKLYGVQHDYFIWFEER